MKITAWTALDAALFATGLWLVTATPIAFIGGDYDDLLFAREAGALLDGHWLGAFDQLTLSKGCLYPIFLALAARLHVPILLATQAVYLSAALLFSRIGATRPAASLRFALLALSPVLLDGSCAMLMREPLYAALTLAVLASFAKLLLGSARWPLALLCGATLAAFWLTREEGIWLLPAIGILLVRAVIARPLGGSNPGAARRIFAALILVSTFATCLLAVAMTNKSAYGVFRTNDFQQGPFPSAYGALSRIEHTTWQRLIPVPQDSREKAYQVSPAARELQPFLEGELGRHWIELGCQSNPIPDCHDFQAGWFVWALRDAATRAGHYSSARDADRFYRRLAKEIDTGCNTTIKCLPSRHGYLPPLQHIDFDRIMSDTILLARSTAALGPPNPHGLPSLVPEASAALYRRVTPETRPAPQFSFDAYPGWTLFARIETQNRETALSVPAEPGGLVQSSLKQDSTNTLSGDIRCAPGACALQATRDGQKLAAWPLASLVQGQVLNAPGLRIVLDRLSPLPVTPPPPPTLQERTASLLSRVAPPISLIAFPLAVLWTLWRCARDLLRWRIETTTLLAAATATAIASRITLLAVLDATSIPVQFRYEIPAMVLVPALIGLMLADFLPRPRTP